jgi:hypothetical protein
MSGGGGDLEELPDLDDEVFQRVSELSADEDTGHSSEDGNDDEDDGGWPDRETGQLIELFRTNPILYNVSHKWYANRERKDRTYNDMARELGISGR